MAGNSDDVVSVWDENGREHKVSRARSLVLRARGYRATAPSGSTPSDPPTEAAPTTRRRGSKSS